MNENKFYGVFKKEEVDGLKIQIDYILGMRDTKKDLV